jgi:hypothetical protein
MNRLGGMFNRPGPAQGSLGPKNLVVSLAYGWIIETCLTVPSPSALGCLRSTSWPASCAATARA